MLKMLIVDDFFYDREDAREIVVWEQFSIEVAGVAANGREALEFVRESPPDIVLTDIEMPEMNGIELTTKIKSLYPSMKVIFMSCYSEFEYARNALHLDVSAYITKPLMEKEVHDVFGQVCRTIQSEKQNMGEKEELRQKLKESLPILRERFLRNLLLDMRVEQGKLWEQAEYFEMGLSHEAFQLLVFEIDDYNSYKRDLSIEDRQLVEINIAGMIQKVNREKEFFDNLFFIQVDDVHFSLIINDNKVKSLTEEGQYSMGFCRYVRESIDAAQLPGITLVLSYPVDDMADISQQYRACLDAMKHKFFVGGNQLLYLGDIPNRHHNISIDLNQLKQDIRNIICSRETESVSDLMDEYFLWFWGSMSEECLKNLVFSTIVCLQLLLAEMEYNMDTIFGEEMVVWKKLTSFNTIVDVKQWMWNILSLVRESVQKKNHNKSRKIAETVKKFVETHYMEELTVQKIAEELYYSPNYLNGIFQKETGGTIPELISSVRVEKAKELLGDPKYKLYEIVEMVGYKHPPHFNTIFRKFTGMTPKEYRESI